MKNYAYTQDLNASSIERNFSFSIDYEPQINQQPILTQKDYHHSIALITALQELIDIEEAKIADYFRRKKV